MTQQALFTDPSWTAAFSLGQPVTEPHYAEVGCWGIVTEVGDEHITVRFDTHPYFEPHTTRYGSDHGLVIFDGGRSAMSPQVGTATDDWDDHPIPAVVPTNDDDPGAATPRPSPHATHYDERV